MHDSFQFIGRRIDDEFRRVALEEAGRKMASGTTIKDMKQRVIQRLLDQGQTAFVDKLGRKWRLDSYAEMVARTTTREAASAATINTCREAGLDLVKITTHYPTCEKCAPLQGKVFSISGQDKRYPKLTDEYRPPIHPNCRHTLQPYVRELDPDADKVQKYSNTSLTKDPRSEEEKQAYKEMRDAVIIATNRRRAREVLYNEQAPLIERLKAAEKLKKSYEKVGDKINNIDKHYLKGLDKYLENLNIKNIVKIDEVSGIITIKGNKLPKKAFENAIIDALHPTLNKVVQRRLYDEKGNAKVDIDLTDHGHPKAHPIVPHAHDWIEGKRSEKLRELTETEKESVKDIGSD
ncbi:phage minor capsid protein [Carboxydocella sp. ULO1]|uniref:phage minor capsid protein n=1 Tax=Carboxydocella sp. ULO1 TaxID=1926599 RepID=UPI00241C325F|nr:phage minor capsid protein [Carboxydocella sp. ULO1]